MRPRPSRRPGLEPLESRVVLSPTAYTVNSTDGGTLTGTTVFSISRGGRSIAPG
jgi:hypothetical protein